MELMILKMNKKNGYYAGFNRHEWLAFDGAAEYNEFLNILKGKRGYFEVFGDEEYGLAFIDLKTAKAVDKKFGFEGSFVRAYKLRTVKEK